MKASQLIAILANHMVEHGDFEVFLSPEEPTECYRKVAHCWYNYGQEWNQSDRIIIAGVAEWYTQRT